MKISQLLPNLYVHQYLFQFECRQELVLPRYYIPLLRDSLKHHVFEAYSLLNTPRSRQLFSIFRQPERALTEFTHSLAINKNHPILSYLSGKVTPPWWFSYANNPTKTIYHKGDTFYIIFNICGYLNQAWQEPQFLSTLQQWAKSGIGIPSASFHLAEINEIHPNGQPHLIAQHKMTDLPAMPINITAYTDKAPTYRLQVQLLSPTLTEKFSHSHTFTTLAEKILARALRLQLLYCAGDTLWAEMQNNKWHSLYYINENTPLLPGAENIETQQLQLAYNNFQHLSPAPHNVKPKYITVEGYTGNLTYTTPNSNLLMQYMPLLKIGELLHIGEQIGYGCGQIKCNAI